jgi:hypothetical protein
MHRAVSLEAAQARIVGGFLVPERPASLQKNVKLSAEQIHTILEPNFRNLATTLGHSPAQERPWDPICLVCRRKCGRGDHSAEIDEIKAVLRQKDEEVALIAQRLGDVEREPADLQRIVETQGRQELSDLTMSLRNAEREMKKRDERDCSAANARDKSVTDLLAERSKLARDLGQERERNRRRKARASNDDTNPEELLASIPTYVNRSLVGRPHGKLYSDSQKFTLKSSNFCICSPMGAPLSDLTQIGKMRDAYPLLIRSVEHINKLFENDAIPEGLVWCPLWSRFHSCPA